MAHRQFSLKVVFIAMTVAAVACALIRLAWIPFMRVVLVFSLSVLATFLLWILPFAPAIFRRRN